jgi:hypothetical protein
MRLVPRLAAADRDQFGPRILICHTPDTGGTMGKVIAAITTSVDGYIVGPQDGPESASGASVSTTG